MYLEPLTIYREYIQNAADAIDEARVVGLFDPLPKPRIDISLDPEARVARIRDNAAGIPRSSFAQTLTAFGGSKKRGKNSRGFRGIGRLSGLAYCEKLTFRTKAAADDEVSIIHWDGKRLKELLLDHKFRGGLEDIVFEIATLERRPALRNERHFFEVEMLGVVRHKNDVLLNEDAVTRYVSEVGPTPFHPDFNFGSEMAEHLARWGAGASYNIYINDSAEPVYRPFKNGFEVRGGRSDTFTEWQPLVFDGLSEDVTAVGWLLHHSYQGALNDSLGLKGLRLRKGNIQVGSADLLRDVFVEGRFNSWCVGEIHAVSRNLIPNGRRDFFEQNRHFLHLINQISPVTDTIARLSRSKSRERQAGKGTLPPKGFVFAPSQEEVLSSAKPGVAAIVRRVADLLLTLELPQIPKIVGGLVRSLTNAPRNTAKRTHKQKSRPRKQNP
jgi:molecular chaperone HtpG